MLGLSANTFVQSENEGTTNANFLCRCYANEVGWASFLFLAHGLVSCALANFLFVSDQASYAIDELHAAAGAKDAAAAYRAWLVGREYVDAWISFVDQVILPERVGDPFPFLLRGRVVTDSSAGSGSGGGGGDSSKEPEACRVAGKYLDCVAARAAAAAADAAGGAGAAAE